MENPPVFQPVKITWKGVEYTIAPSRMMKCIAIIEDIATLPFLSKCMATGEMPYAKIAMAFAAVLQYAGASVSAEDVYAEMFKGYDRRAMAGATLLTLLTMMFPPEHLREMEGGKAKKPVEGADDAKRGASRRPTKQR